jgi:chemosensory pili system protein ChpA (sensor histidine kinase/response regulator)
MSTNIDLTTLAWCLPEIRSSMQKAEESLQAFYAQPEQPDTDALGVASKSIQQAHGALRVLSLQGVELLTQEAIALIDGIAKKTIADGVLLKPTLTALQSSFSAVIGYLESLERGEMAQPIYLFVYYRDILLCKGVDRVHPAELFFPTEHAQLQTLGVATEPLDDATRAQARMEFERGLLKFLRGTASEDAYNEMFSSVAQFEAEHRDSADRNFWLATLSFFEGLKAGAFDNDVLAKKLLARLNIHMKTVQPNAVMPDKLFKEVLFSLACASKFTPMVSAVREAYGLDNSVPRDYDKPKYALLDRSALAIAKDSLAKTKALLDKIVRGSNDDIAAFCSAVELFAKATTQLPVGGLQPSAKGLQMASGSLRSSAKEAMANESMLLELATITLFAETILDEGVKASEEQNGQGKELAQRVELAVQGRLGKDVAMPVWLQVLSQSAQERITVATFINEAQINLRNVEKALDTFFRDPDDKKELTPCGGQLRQVAGALALLGHGHAMSAAQALATQVDKMVEATETPSKAECDKVAESLGTLGFFVDRLGQKDESAGNFKFDSQTGTFAAVNSADASAATAPAKVVQIQMASIARTIKPVEPVLVAPPAPAPAPAPVPELKFPDVVAPAIVAAAFVAPMIELPTELPPVAAPVAKVEVAVKAELSQEDAEAAQELREIFLMEAQEVLEAIETHTVLLRKEPTSDDHMTTIRRAFHTLKGSSRMVGLDQFGTAGWAMEQLLNLWLSEKRAATDELFALIDHSHGVFTGWTTGLEQGDESCVHPEDLVARADALREGHAFVAPTVAQAAPVAAPIVEVMVESISEQTIVEESEALAFDELSFDEPVFDVTPPVDIVATLDAPAPVEVSAFESPVFGELTFEDVEAFRVESAPDPIVIATPEVIPEPVFEPAFDAEFELDSAEPEAALFADDQPKESEDLQIGDNTISRALFNIFLSEADDMLAVLRSDADDWQLDASRSANKEARRAVHSIAGSANLVGLSHVSEVAHQVDLFLQRHLASGLVASVKERAVYLTVVERLAGMLHQFAGGQQPADNADLFDDAVALAAGIHADAPLDIDVLDFDQMEVSDLVKADMMEVNEASDESALFAEESAFAEDVFASDEGALFAEELVQPAVAVVPAVAVAAFNEERRAVPRPPQENLRDDEYSLEENHFDADLLPVFIEEAEDYLPKIAASLRQWLEAPDSQESPRSLMRYMHTVKGSARMAGAMELGQRVHEMETRIEHATDAASVLADGEEKHSLIEALLGDHDHVIALFDKIKDPSVVAAVIAESNAANAAATANEASEIELFASDEQPAVSASLTAAAVVAAGAMTANALSHSPSAQVAATAPAAAPVNVTTQLVQGTQQAASAQLVRVRADLLDRMVSDAGEASIARSRVENELTGMRSALSELSENVSRLRTQLREIEVQAESQIQARIASSKESHAEFDPLEFDRFTRFQEVSRMLAESVNDVATVQQNSMRGLDEANRDLQRQSQVMRELQQNLMRIRLVQVGSISERLYRVVRQAAKETGKKVNLDIRGSATEIDRSVLERMASAFEHLLRNAVAHGIETPDVRTAARKIETGEIVFEIKQVGNEIVVALSDNGAGLDYPRIRERAIAKGMIVAGSNPSERELGQMIFMPGFSTATNVTEIAGRGVGMDVVRSEVAALGGRLDTESTTGLGTRFTITLPLSLAVTQVVVIESGQYHFAVASSAVEQVLQLKPQALVAAYADQGLEWLGERVPVVHLASLLDLSDKSPVAQHYSPVLIVKIGERRIAVHVDSVSKNQEVVLKNMGPQLARVNGVVGATVMGNGDIVLIINPVQFADQMDLRFRTSDEQRMAQTLLRDSNETFTVMVVDDSVTVRKVSQRFLQREGYEVILAKDGVDALRQLQDHMPDVMLVDIEMPRMDGYDLTRAIRADQRLKHIPIVMITSRTADKHRNYALSLGVNAYMGKPYSEADLAETIKSYIGQGAFTKDVAAISN